MNARCRNIFFLGFFFVLFMLVFSLPAWADHPQDGNHDLAEMPADCVGCHNSEGGTHYSVVGEHRFRLGCDNHRLCAYCHYNPDSPFFDDPTFPWDDDPDLAVAITFGRRNTNPRGYIEPVYCAYCHVTENRSTHVHPGEHDHAGVPSSCQGCHGSSLVDVHIDPDKNLPDEADLPPAGFPGTPEREAYEAAYAAGLAELKLSCYTCHGDAVIGTSSWDLGKVYFQPDPVVRAAVASGMAGDDIACEDCHGNAADHRSAHDHAILPVGEDCGSCHAANVVDEHVANHGLSCAACHDSTDQLVVDAIALGSTPSSQDVDCHACHQVVDHSAAHNRIYLRTRLADGSETIITSTDDIADGTFDDLPPYRPSLTCGACHQRIASDHAGNYHSGLRTGEMLDEGGSPLPRGTLDPARPWISGPGVFGNWCPTYQRQLADMSASYTSESEFLEKVDLSAFDFLKNCSICHVGGGPGDRNPFGYQVTGLAPHDDHDNPERAAALDADEANGNHDLVPLNAWDFHVEDGMVVRSDWSGGTGVLDVDCLLCHLDGYDFFGRNQQIRRFTRFRQAAAVGAGLGTVDAAVAGSDNFDYDRIYVNRDENNQLYLSWYTTYRINRVPRSDNCINCHMPDMVMHENETEQGDLWQSHFYADAAIPGGDFATANLEPAVKRNDSVKRGDSWRQDEVHKFMGCGGCHSETGKFSARDQHSPGKGLDPLKFASAADVTVKMCEDCHVLYGDLDGDGQRDTMTYGPPEMQVYHDQAGLLAKIVPTARRVVDAEGNEEEFLGSHIDILSCTACHVEKRFAAARSVDFTSGRGYYNLVGTPPDQIPDSDYVPLAYSWRENTNAKVIDGEPNPYWRRQIYPFNYLTSMYWDNYGSADANGDGYRRGDSNSGVTVIGDPFFMRTIAEQFNFDHVNDNHDPVASGLSDVGALDQRDEWSLAGQDGNIIFSRPQEIDAFQNLMQAVNPGYLPRLKLESRPFLVVHNVMPTRSGSGLSGGAAYALGTPTRDAGGQITAYGCSQCHGGSEGVFNGEIDMLGRGVAIADNTPVSIEISWNDAGDVETAARAWQRDGSEFELDFTAANQTRTVERREFLGYDPARVAALNAIVPAEVGVGVDPVADIAAIDGQDPDVVLPYIEIVQGSTVTLVAADGAAHGSFTYRWNFSDSPDTVEGQSVDYQFNATGLVTVSLTVIDEESKVSRQSVQVNVVAPAPQTTFTYTATAGSPSVTLSLAGLPAHDLLYFYYGDGRRERVYHSAASIDHQHNYRLLSRYLSNGSYNYLTSVRIYQGGTYMETIQDTVSIPQ